MSTTAYRSTHSSTTSFSRRQNRTPTSSSPMTNDRSRFNPRTNNNFTVPVPPPRESLSNSSTAVSSNSPANSSSYASLPTPSSDIPPPARFRSVNETDSSENTTSKVSKQQLYMFSNRPRILQRQPAYGNRYLRDGRMRQRVSSAPDENCLQTPPHSPLTQQQPKPSSANETLTPRSRDDSLDAHSRQPSLDPSLRSVVRFVKRDDQQQKNSLAALMQEQQRSKVPEAVQKRRILLLLRRVSPASSPPVPSPRQQHLSAAAAATPASASTLKSSTHSPDLNRTQHGTINRDERQQSLLQQCVVIPATSSGSHLQQQQQQQTHSSSPAPSGFSEPDFADSMQLAAILASIQQQDEWNPGSDSDRSPATQINVNPRRTTSNVAANTHQLSYDPTKYEYVVANSLDTTTFKLSPRTLRPDEQFFARSRQSQYYRQEMRSSTNAQPPPLLASIIADNSHSGSGGSGDKTITLRLNTTGPMKKQSSLEDVDPFGSTLENGLDGEQVPLCFDEILKCFYDPTTGLYYELWAT